MVKSVFLPVLRHATRSYVSGDHLRDAIDLAERAASKNFSCTLCYWNDGKEDPSLVASEYSKIIASISDHALDGILALKVPAVWNQPDAIDPVVGLARKHQTTIVLDSHAIDWADANYAVLERLGSANLGVAIPGRWARSLRDADRAIDLGARIRVVKGQWPDPEDPKKDLREGYLDVINRLAGRAKFVGVATHDAPLAAKAMRILADAGTPFEQEFVFPLPVDAAMREGLKYGVNARLYLPYGEAWLPYSVSRAYKNPIFLYWLARDLILGRKFELPTRTSSRSDAPMPSDMTS